MNAVNRPGSLYFSMMAMVFAQIDLANFGSVMSGGSFLLACAAMSSITAFCASRARPTSCRASA